jgi:hypothetical protein
MKRIAVPVFRFPSSNVTSFVFRSIAINGPGVIDVLEILVVVDAAGFLFAHEHPRFHRTERPARGIIEAAQE